VAEAETLFPALLKTLSDTADEVVVLSVQALARIAGGLSRLNPFNTSRTGTLTECVRNFDRSVYQKQFPSS